MKARPNEAPPLPGELGGGSWSVVGTAAIVNDDGVYVAWAVVLAQPARARRVALWWNRHAIPACWEVTDVRA